MSKSVKSDEKACASVVLNGNKEVELLYGLIHGSIRGLVSFYKKALFIIVRWRFLKKQRHLPYYLLSNTSTTEL